MSDDNRSLLRRERSQQGVALLDAAIQRWLTARRLADFDGGAYTGRHETQLATLQNVLEGALGKVQSDLAGLDPRLDLGECYQACRMNDQILIWIQRLWEYFQVRFDQRHDVTAPPDTEVEAGAGIPALLRAADEVVWSCYRPVCAAAGALDPAFRQGPSPLPYVDSEYSPAAIAADRLPAGLRLNVPATGMDEFIRGLPLPALRLPPWCVDAPWWLVYVGHEVGHQVQGDLKVVGAFRLGVVAAAGASGLSAAGAEAWGAWQAELFADLFSYHTMGPWALRALAEVELAPLATMRQARELYPAPIVRLAFGAAVLDRLGIDPRGALDGLDLAGLAGDDRRVKADLAAVTFVADFAVGPLSAALGPLAGLVGLDAAEFAAAGAIDDWADKLMGKADPPVTRRIELGRLLACAAYSAWDRLETETPGPSRNELRAALAHRTCRLLRAAAPAGKRSVHGPGGALAERGAALHSLLNAAAHEHKGIA